MERHYEAGNIFNLSVTDYLQFILIFLFNIYPIKKKEE